MQNIGVLPINERGLNCLWTRIGIRYKFEEPMKYSIIESACEIEPCRRSFEQIRKSKTTPFFSNCLKKWRGMFLLRVSTVRFAHFVCALKMNRKYEKLILKKNIYPNYRRFLVYFNKSLHDLSLVAIVIDIQT
jgi:hypothetical protein